MAASWRKIFQLVLPELLGRKCSFFFFFSIRFLNCWNCSSVFDHLDSQSRSCFDYRLTSRDSWDKIKSRSWFFRHCYGLVPWRVARGRAIELDRGTPVRCSCGFWRARPQWWVVLFTVKRFTSSFSNSSRKFAYCHFCLSSHPVIRWSISEDEFNLLAWDDGERCI